MRLLASPEREGFSQRLADTRIWSDVALGPGADRESRREPVQVAATRDWKLVYDGPGLVEGRIERVVSRIAPGGERRVEFADGESFELTADGMLLRRVEGRLPSEIAATRALGAPLALALALRGVYLLHASAVGRDGRALALAAPSGGGKSTLARHAVAYGLPRVADDILPVRLEPRPEALPRFPQPKLTDEERYPEAAPDRLRLGALVEIAHSPRYRSISATRLEPADAAFALARATVAARLFDESLLARHFAACAHAASALPLFRLTYPSGVERLGDVAEALRRLPLDGS